ERRRPNDLPNRVSRQKRRCARCDALVPPGPTLTNLARQYRPRFGAAGPRNFCRLGALAARPFGRSFSMANQERSSKEFDKAAGTVEDIQHDLQVVRDDLSRLAQQVASLLSVTGSQALREVKAQMSRAKHSLDGVLSDAGEKGMEAADTV